MAELFSPEELRRQARQHLESLRAAGVEWLPLASTPATPPAQMPGSAEPTPIRAPHAEGLFAAAVERPALDPENRRQTLHLLKEEVSRCTRCPDLAAKRTQTVFGV